MENITNNNSLESSQEAPILEESVESSKPELSAEEQLRNLEGSINTKEEEISRLTKSISDTKDSLDKVRESLGLLPEEDVSPSILQEKNKIEKLKYG